MANDPNSRSVTAPTQRTFKIGTIMIPTHIINTLEHTWASISALCGDLSEEQWKTQTQLPGWTVQDNLSHMIGTERMLQGLSSTEHRAVNMTHVKNPIGEFNEHEVDARRNLRGADVLTEWNELTQLRVSTLRTAGDEYFDQETMTPTGPGTVADFLHIRVLDCWLHEQDMRIALHLPGNTNGPAAEHTIDRLIRTIPIVVGKRAATPDGDSVIINITGPVIRQICVTVKNGRAQIDNEVSPTPRCSISIDSPMFVQLATGRINGADAAGACVIEGDTDLSQRIINNFNMMI
jgi:uncharacterized protein (TIGR03083 family)